MLNILRSIKNIFVHIRSWLKLIITIAIAIILIIAIISVFYKPAYSVSLNGEFIGYTNDKNALQKEINEYMNGLETQNIAFVEIDNMPEYSLCFVRRNSQDDTNEIYDKVINQGTTYYEYYAVMLDNEEKYYVTTKEEAETAINALKKKNSNNIDKIAYTVIYDTQTKECSDQDTIVAGLYEKKKVVYKDQSATWATGITTAKLDLGISLIKPVQSGYTITSRFGTRSSGMHKGLDIAAPSGTQIYAAAEGTVTFSGWSTSGYGYCVVISHGNGIDTLYGHCSKLYVSEGQTVSQGQNIAAVGTTGNSTGNHLHLEIRVNGTRVNPQHYLY